MERPQKREPQVTEKSHGSLGQSEITRFEVDAAVEAMLGEFSDLSQKLQITSDAGDATSHFEATIAACRLSRRIRLKLGNLWRLSGNVRERVTDLFSDCADKINLDLDFGDERKPHVEHAKANITTRVEHIEHPEKVEEELLGSGVQATTYRDQ
jgi:hypothetical protein